MSQSNAGYNVWGVVASVLSHLAFISVIAKSLPIRQARVFDGTLADTQRILYSYVEDGYLDAIFISQADLRLSRYVCVC